MNITVNGKAEEARAGTTVSEFLKEKNLDESTVVVELNCTIVPGGEFSETILKDGDTLEVLRFVGGG